MRTPVTQTKGELYSILKCFKHLTYKSYYINDDSHLLFLHNLYGIEK